MKHLPQRQPLKYQLIDGNFTHYPVAYCEFHQLWLTEGLMNTHRCEPRKCRRLQKEVFDNDT